MKKVHVKFKDMEPYFFDGKSYDVVKEFRAPDLFGSGNETDFVLVKDELGIETELPTDVVEFV